MGITLSTLLGANNLFLIIFLDFYIRMDTVMLNNTEIIDEMSNSLPVEEADKNNTGENNIRLANDCLSKRAQRKLLKRQQWLETRPERRAKEKAKKRAKIEKIRQEKGMLRNGNLIRGFLGT